MYRVILVCINALLMNLCLFILKKSCYSYSFVGHCVIVFRPRPLQKPTADLEGGVSPPEILQERKL